jgi:choice-of-anchor A domain-containing protein
MIAMPRLSPALLLATLVAAPLIPARATTSLTDLQILDQFNAVSFTTFSSASDVEGRTVVGTNLTGGATFYNNPGSNLASSSYAALTVYGNATGGQLNVNNGGGFVIAGNNQDNININGSASASTMSVVGGANSGNVNTPGGTVYLGSNSGSVNINGTANVSLNGANTGTISTNGGTFTYTGASSGSGNRNNTTVTQAASVTNPASTLGSFSATFQTPLTQLSTQLAGLTANSATSVSGNALSFNAAPNSSGVAVFNVNSSVFTTGSLSTVAINLDGATTVIINVTVSGCTTSTGCVLDMPGSLNFTNPTGYAETVLWNFVNATSLDFSTEFGGTVLAPDAQVSNSSPIDGTVVANSISTTGEIHEYAYTGTLPGSTVAVTGQSTAAPEPASLAVIGSGMAALGWVKRRRKSKRAAS